MYVVSKYLKRISYVCLYPLLKKIYGRLCLLSMIFNVRSSSIIHFPHIVFFMSFYVLLLILKWAFVYSNYFLFHFYHTLICTYIVVAFFFINGSLHLLTWRQVLKLRVYFKLIPTWRKHSSSIRIRISSTFFLESYTEIDPDSK